MIKLDELFEIITTAVIVFNAKGECVYVNDACQSLLYKSKRWLIGQCIETIFAANQQAVAQCRDALVNKRYMALREIDIPLPDWQRSLLLDLKLSPFDNGKMEGMVLEMVDSKDFKKLSQDTDKTARFKAATRIIRGLCHEIRNPLGGIRGAAQLLEMESNSDDVAEYTKVITNEVDRLNALLNRMSGGMKTDARIKVDIHEMLMHMSNVLKAEYPDQFEMNYDFDTSLPRLTLGVGQIEQALLNLMKNSVQWSLISDESRDHKRDKTPPAVSLKTRAVFPDLMRSLMPQRGIQIQISDNGPGVDESLIDQLFLPMVSKREGGTGLGLVISQEIVQSHGGFIELDENQPEYGASFSLYLPFNEQGPAS